MTNNLFASFARHILRKVKAFFFYFTQYHYITKYLEKNNQSCFFSLDPGRKIMWSRPVIDR